MSRRADEFMQRNAEFLKKEKNTKNIPANKQHDNNKLTARERIVMLLDKKTFVETDLFVRSSDPQMQHLKSDGVVTGYGKIDGRHVCVYAQDFTQKGGTLGEMHAKKIVKIMDLAIKTGCPIIGIEDSGGARIQEGIKALDGYARIFQRNTEASGVVPQISVVAGPCAGGAVYSPALTDFVFMVKGLSKMFITGPRVIKSVLSEKVSPDELGGAEVHAEMTGVAHFEEQSEPDALTKVRKLLSYLPLNNITKPPLMKTGDTPNRNTKKLMKIVPADPEKSYDVKDVLCEVLDKNSVMEIQPAFAKNIVIALARLNNKVVGVVANQPSMLAGCIDIDASEKAARFVRFCDAFNIPLINFVDVPGYLPGKEQEYHGIIKHGADLLYAYAESTVPKISLIMRKAYGGAYIVMCSKEMGFDQVIAWPIARIAVMGSRQAAEIIFKGSEDRQVRQQEYSEKFLNPYVAADIGSIDMIIDPSKTRQTLIKSLESLATKRVQRRLKKHGNMPL